MVDTNIVLNKGTLTNNDVVKGKVHLNLRSEATLKAITVKMEGVARTVVPMVPPGADPNNHKERSKKDAIEVHKVLYQVATVFPPPDVRKNSTQNQFTLPAGSYSYDFEFRIPIKGECMRSGTMSGGTLPQVMFNASGLDYARSATNHINGPLPPSLSGLGELASVKYFFKATVVRASFFKANSRDLHPFVFLPMDVHANPNAANRIGFVRRDVTIGVDPMGGGTNSSASAAKGKKRGFLGTLSSALTGSSPNTYRGRTMTISFEVRHPQDLGIVPVSPLPFEFYVMLSNPPNTYPVNSVLLDELSMVLYATTDARAQEHNTQSHLRLELYSGKSLQIPVEFANANPIQNRFGVQVSPKHMHSILQSSQIPDYVPPSFTTCNISRAYALEIVAGFSAYPGAPTEHVSIMLEPEIRSGIRYSNDPQQPGQIGKPSKGEYTEATPQAPPLPEKHHMPPQPGAEQGELPSYESVINEQANASHGPEQERRQFGQSKDYFENMDKDD
uniref:ARAD1D02728p n=1 Tax=Blastobotrys adeninivorans TaxID=409370 RepID=A0A060TDT7_BLAAD